MADIIRNAIIRLGIEQGETKLKAPDLSKILEAKEKEIALAKKLKEESEAARKAEKGFIDDIVAAQQKLIDKQNALQKEIEDSAAAQKQMALSYQDNTQQMIGSTQQVGEGFFMLARSAALLGTDGAEELAKLLQKLALLQGAFDAFKGVAMIFQGVIAAKKALTLATEAAALANTANAVAANVEATALNRAAVAAVALNTALGPQLIVLGAIVVVVGAAVAAYKLLNAETDDEIEAYKELNPLMQRRLDLQQKTRKNAEQAYKRQEERKQKIGGLSEADTEKELADLKERNFVAELEKMDRMAKKRGAENQKYKVLAEDQIQGLEVVAGYQDTIISQIERRNQLEAEATKQANDKLEAQVKEIEVAQTALETAEKALKIEKEKTQSIEARFGALSKIEQEEIKSLDRKLKDKTATLAEAKRAAEIAPELLGPMAGQQLAAAGRGAGIGDIGGGTAAREKASRDALVDAKAGLSESGGGDDAKAAIAALKKLQEDNNETQAEFLNKNNTLLRTAITQQEHLQTRVDQIDNASAGAL